MKLYSFLIDLIIFLILIYYNNNNNNSSGNRKTIWNYHSENNWNIIRILFLTPCEYFIRRLIKFSFYFIQMNISFQTNGKLLNLFSIDIHHTKAIKRLLLKRVQKKKKKYDSKWFIYHVCVRSNLKKKRGKKKRILLPVRTHPRENKLIEWIHARVPRKSFVRGFTCLHHVWFSAEESVITHVSIKVTK